MLLAGQHWGLSQHVTELGPPSQGKLLNCKESVALARLLHASKSADPFQEAVSLSGGSEEPSLTPRQDIFPFPKFFASHYLILR